MYEMYFSFFKLLATFVGTNRILLCFQKEYLYTNNQMSVFCPRYVDRFNVCMSTFKINVDNYFVCMSTFENYVDTCLSVCLLLK